MTLPQIWKSDQLKNGFRVRLRHHEEGHEDRHTVISSTLVKLESGGDPFFMVELRNDRTGREDFHMVGVGFEWVEFVS